MLQIKINKDGLKVLQINITLSYCWMWPVWFLKNVKNWRNLSNIYGILSNISYLFASLYSFWE